MSGGGYELADLKRIVTNLFNVCEVVEVSDSGVMVRVSLAGKADSDFIPVMSQKAHKDASVFPLSVGEQVLVVVPDGEWSGALCLGSIFRGSDVPPGASRDLHKLTYEDGTKYEYDKKKHKLTLSMPEKGSLKLEVNGTVELSADTKMGLKSKEMALNETPTALGVVTGECVCAFTGAPHPQFSRNVKAGL